MILFQIPIPTPTPYGFTQSPVERIDIGGNISIWNYAGDAINVWNEAGEYTEVLQWIAIALLTFAFVWLIIRLQQNLMDDSDAE
jgi:hypothetical protein